MSTRAQRNSAAASDWAAQRAAKIAKAKQLREERKARSKEAAEQSHTAGGSEVRTPPVQ